MNYHLEEEHSQYRANRSCSWRKAHNPKCFGGGTQEVVQLLKPTLKAFDTYSLV